VGDSSPACGASEEREFLAQEENILVPDGQKVFFQP